MIYISSINAGSVNVAIREKQCSPLGFILLVSYSWRKFHIKGTGMLVGKKGDKTYQSGRGRLKFEVDFFPTEVIVPRPTEVIVPRLSYKITRFLIQAPNCVGIFTFPAGDFLI